MPCSAVGIHTPLTSFHMQDLIRQRLTVHSMMSGDIKCLLGSTTTQQVCHTQRVIQSKTKPYRYYPPEPLLDNASLFVLTKNFLPS